MAPTEMIKTSASATTRRVRSTVSMTSLSGRARPMAPVYSPVSGFWVSAVIIRHRRPGLSELTVMISKLPVSACVRARWKSSPLIWGRPYLAAVSAEIHSPLRLASRNSALT